MWGTFAGMHPPPKSFPADWKPSGFPGMHHILPGSSIAVLDWLTPDRPEGLPGLLEFPDAALPLTTSQDRLLAFPKALGRRNRQATRRLKRLLSFSWNSYLLFDIFSLFRIGRDRQRLPHETQGFVNQSQTCPSAIPASHLEYQEFKNFASKISFWNPISEFGTS